MTDLNELFKVIAEGKKQYEDTDPVGQQIKQAKEHVKEDLSSLFSQLSSLKEDLEKELVVEEAKLVSLIDSDSIKRDAKNIVNEVFGQIKKPMITEEIPAQPIIHTPEVRAKQVDADVDKYLTDKSFQQPNPDLVTKNIDDIRNKIKFLEQAIGRVAAAGPGGGEVNLRYLDDVDRSTITDGWYLRYSATKKKFEFAEVISSGGNGATGPAGATGVTGSSGAQGASGISGATGINGASGVQGASGIQGASGATGTQGASGSTGLIGATGLQGDRYQTTSNTTQTIANSGQLTFYTNDLGLAYSAEQTVIVVANDGHHMHGTVVSYDKVTGALVLDINSKVGSGTYSFWTINLDGAVGAIGASGINGATGATGIQGASGIGATGLTGSTGPQGNPGSGGSIANYGSFYDTTDQIASLVDTAYPIPLGQTAEAVGTSIVDGTKVKVDYQGVYNIQFSLQLHNRGGAGSGTTVEIWLRKNGTDIADSATKVDVDTNSPWSVPAWNFMLTLQANDYVQLMWSTSNTAIAIEHNTAVAPAPAIPSTILTIQQVMYTQVGATGYTGSTGVQGASGATGIQGASGVGATGLTGATGVQGSSGPSGISATDPALYGSYEVTGRSTVGDYTLTRLVGSMPVESSNFVTLLANKTYELRASLSIRSNYATFAWYTEAGVQLGLIGDSFSANSTDPGVNAPAYAVYTPTVDTRVKLRLTAVNVYVQTDTGYGEVSIKQFTGQGPIGATGIQGASGATGPGMTYASGYVNAGTFVTLDNIKATVTTSGQRGLALATVSGTISSFIGGYGSYATNAFVYNTTNGASPYSITTSTGNTSIFGWSFSNASDTAIYHVNDLTNSKFYRITMMIGGGYNNNAITIERLI